VPGERLGECDRSARGADEVLVRVSAGIAHAILGERSRTVRVAARNESDAAAVHQLFKEELPEVVEEDPEVPVRFWWWQSPHGPRELARMLPASSWSEVQGNYPGASRRRLTEMADWRGAPPPGGRLILWHGEPGTGKTSAIRALASEWRSWAGFHFVTDPEEFLANPSYLLSTISENHRRALAASLKQWRVVVLEDAGDLVPRLGGSEPRRRNEADPFARTSSGLGTTRPPHEPSATRVGRYGDAQRVRLVRPQA